MTEIQKAILAYRKTWIRGKSGGTILALSHILNQSKGTIYNWLKGKPPTVSPSHHLRGWTQEDVEKILEEIQNPTYTPTTYEE